MVIGSRVKLMGRTIERLAWRHYLGRIFATAASLVLDLPVYDTQCGAKLFRATPLLAQVFAEPFLARWVFDVEIIARFMELDPGGPDRIGEALFELPLRHWIDVHGSKVKPVDFAQSARDLALIFARTRVTVRRAATLAKTPGGTAPACYERAVAVHWPYTTDFLTSLFAAQSSIALMLSALVLFWRFGSIASRWAMLVGIWLAVLALGAPPFAVSLGYKPGPLALRELLAISAGFGTLSAVLALRLGVATLGLAGQIALWLLSGFVTESEGELCGLCLAWLGLMLGLLERRAHPAASPARSGQPPAEPSYAVHDALVFVLATLAAVLVCLLVMRKRDGTGDEWAYTYQAAVFAKGRIYAASPRCQSYLQNFYVFESGGRLFSQYTPGWPLYLVPFVWLRAVWLGGPVALGLAAVGIARLSRSAARALTVGEEHASLRTISAAGTWGAALATLGTTILILAASRYSHVFLIALYAWAAEALLVVTTPGIDSSRQVAWGCMLGSAAALACATRLGEGFTLGLGMAVVFLDSLARRRVGWRALAATTGTFAFWGGLTLVILRVQLGRWFTTGYSLNAVIHPWNTVTYSWPQPNQWKYGLPLATGAYCWWPCSIALALAGLALVRSRLVAALGIGCLAYEIFCQRVDSHQRGYDWGYGPRYLAVFVVPMAVGAAIAIAPLAVAAGERVVAGRRAIARGGPMALVLFAIASGWLRIVPLVWPTAAEHTRRHTALQTAIDAAHLTNAVVLAQLGTTGGYTDPLDMTTNLPLDLYPNQDVIIAIERSPDAVSCMRSAFPGRRFYRAAGTDEVRLTPF